MLIHMKKLAWIGLLGAAAFTMALQNVSGQKVVPVNSGAGTATSAINSNKYWGCLGYCNGPLKPNNNNWSCLGYCNAPLGSNVDYYTPDLSVATPFTPMYAAAAAAGANAKYLFPYAIPVKQVAPEPPPLDPIEVARLTKELQDNENKIRVQAALELAHKKAKVAVKPLMSMLQDPDPVVRTNAAAALAHFGKEVVGEVTFGLYSDERLTRMGSAMTLGMIGEPAQTALTALKGTLKDPDVRVRGHAAQAIYRINKDAKTAIPILLECLKDEDEHIRIGVVNALALMGKDAQPAATEIKVCFTDKVPLIRVKAAEAYFEIYQDPKSVAAILFPVLEKLALDEDAGIRAESVALLSKLGKHDEKALLLLQNAATDKDAQVGQIAASALFHLGDPAVPSLVKGLSDPNVQVRFRSVTALAQMGLKAEKAIPALINALNDKDIAVRWEAAMALGRMKQFAKPAVEPLIDALEDPAYQVR